MTAPGDGFFVIANGRAGTTARAAVDAALGVLSEHAPVSVRHTESLDELDDAIEHAAGHVLVVAGGDGSLHCVVQRLHAAGRLADAPVGLVPLGTGNDLATALGLPTDPVEAARLIVEGTPRPLDLLVDDGGGVVINAVHAGLGAEAAERAHDKKDRLGPLAYPVGALLAAVRTDGWALRVEVDGTALALPGDRVLMVGVGNGPTIGGGTPLCPGARPDDGALDVMVSCAVGATGRASFGLALRNGSHVDRDDVVSARGTSVRIAGDPVGLDADGELEDGVTDRTWTLQPAAWQLVR